jgi:hypothetical protein
MKINSVEDKDAVLKASAFLPFSEILTVLPLFFVIQPKAFFSTETYQIFTAINSVRFDIIKGG